MALPAMTPASARRHRSPAQTRQGRGRRRCRPTPPEAMIGAPVAEQHAGQTLEVRPGESPVAADIGDDHALAAPAATASGTTSLRPDGRRPRSSPGARTSPLAVVETRPRPGPGQRAASSPTRRGSLHGRRADHDPRHAGVEQLGRVLGVADAPAGLHRTPDRRRRPRSRHDRPVDRLAGAGGVEVDDVDPPAPAADEGRAPRRRGRRRRSRRRSRPRTRRTQRPPRRSIAGIELHPGSARAGGGGHGGHEVGQERQTRRRRTSRGGTGWPTAFPAPPRPPRAAVVAGGDDVRGHGRRGVGVHEVDPRVGARARPAGGVCRARRACSRFHCICGRFTPSAGGARTTPGRTPRPGDPGRSSSDPSKSICNPTQMPRNGRPAATASSATLSRPLRRSASMHRAEGADPGQHDARAAPAASSGSVTSRASAPRLLQAPSRPSGGCRSRSRGRRSLSGASSERPLGRGHATALDPDRVAQGPGHPLERRPRGCGGCCARRSSGRAG